MPRKLKKALIHRISLCPRGANKMPTFYKSEEGVDTIQMLTKADMDEGLLTAVAYAPNIVDAHGDVASAEVIKQMAYDFPLGDQGINIRHGSDTLEKEKARVVESFIIQKGDSRFTDMKDYDGNPVNVTGGWAVVIKIDDEELQKQYRDGEWNGVSIEGQGFFEKSDDSQGVEKLLSFFKSLLGQDTNTQEGDLDMKADEVQKMIDTSAEKTMTGVKDLLKEAGLIKETTKDGDKKTPEAPIFKGDMSNEDDRKAHRKALAIWKAETEIEDPVERFDAIEKIEKEFADSNDDELDRAAGIEKEDTDEVKDLKRRLHKAQKRSNQGTEDVKKSDDDYDFAGTGLTKEDADHFADARDFVKDWEGDDK